MKLVSSSSRDNNKNRVNKTKQKRHDLSEVPQRHIQQTARPVEPQEFSYPKTELTPAQQAALQNVLYKKELMSDRAQRADQAEYPGATNRRGSEYDPAQNEAQRRRRDIHAHSNRKRKKKGSPLVGFIITVLVAAALVAAIYLGWSRWVFFNSPPEADTVDHTILIGESVSPENFVKNVTSDFEIISIEFIEEPDTLAHTNQTVQIRITDEHENNAVFEARLVIKINTTPPVIEGTNTIISRLGNPILYRQGVSAHDDFGRDFTELIEIDSSHVNHNEVGEYTVLYRVMDTTGLVTEVFETVQVLNVDIDYVNERVDEALAEILNDGMSQVEKARAIQIRVQQIISSYATGSRTKPDNSYEGAYRALRDRSGNCFNYYALGEVMLTRAGIPNMEINRIPGTDTRHRWSLINPDNLGWHHFDATPVARMGFGTQTAFFTASQARNFTSRIQEELGTRDFYTYDTSLYPVVVS